MPNSDKVVLMLFQRGFVKSHDKRILEAAVPWIAEVQPYSSAEGLTSTVVATVDKPKFRNITGSTYDIGDFCNLCGEYLLFVEYICTCGMYISMIFLKKILSTLYRSRGGGLVQTCHKENNYRYMPPLLVEVHGKR